MGNTAQICHRGENGHGSAKRLRPGHGVRRLLLFGLLIVLTFGASWATSPERAQAANQVGTPVKLDILALYKSSEGQSEEDNPVYEFLELPLSFLGFRVHYYDVSRGVQAIGPTDRYRAIITWFWDDELNGASRYRRWLLQQVRDGKKLLIFGTFGALSEPGRSPSAADLREVRNVFLALGVDYRGQDWPYARSVQVAHYDPDIFGFERNPWKDRVRGFYPLVPGSSKVRPLVVLRTGLPPARTYLGGFISPKGAFLAQPFTYRVVKNDSSGFKPQFYFDPIVLLRRALGCKEEPHPDLAVLFGRRVFFARVDGDGLTSQTEVNPNYLCGALFRDEILIPTPLPFTASFVQGEIDPHFKGSERAVELAREIMLLPNVEPASHGLGHPMDWEKGELMVKGLRGYERLDPSREIFGSLEFLNQRILRGDKLSNLFLWTGYCNPPASILREVRKRGVLAINGGTSLVFTDVPSLANFNPPFRHVDGEIQVLRRAANDYEFTNYWRGPFDGYRNVIRTFEYGWSRYPMVPIDLYVHYYSAEKKESLEALKQVIRWVRKQPICPTTTSTYIRSALDFLQVRVVRQSDGGWRVRTGGHLRTLRFDFDDRIVDLTRCTGVLGFCRRRGYLYVHLDEAPVHLIYLAPSDTLLAFPPFVVESGNLIERWKPDPGTRAVSFVALGFGTTDIWLAGLHPHTPYRIDSPDYRKTYFAETDSLGRLHVVVPVQRSVSLQLRPTSRRAWAMSYGRYGVLLLVIVLLSLYSVALSRRRARQLESEDDEVRERRRAIRDLWVRDRSSRGGRAR